MVGGVQRLKTKQKTKDSFARKPGSTKQLFWFPVAPTVNLHPVFTHLNFSDSGAVCCHVTRYQDRKRLTMRGQFF